MSIFKPAKKSELLEKHSPDEYEVQMQIGKGWESIAHRLTEQIEMIDPRFTVACIKEKFGTFNYYIIFSVCSDEINREAIYNLIDKAAHEASFTCECCGTHHTVERKSMSWGWIVTLCSTCRELIEEERKNGEF